MGAISDDANSAFREDNTLGLPSSGDYFPAKAPIRALFARIETALDELALAGMATVKKATKAALDADLAHAADTIAIVYNDATAANNGYYVKSGGSGAGSWTKSTNLNVPSTLTADIALIKSKVEDLDAALTADLAALIASDVQPLVDDAEAAATAAAASAASAASAAIDLANAAPELQRYTKTTDEVQPIAADADNQIVLGINKTTGQLVGSGLASGANQTTSNIPLASADIVATPTSARWNGFFMYGQSNATGADAQPALSLSQPYSNRTFGAGVRASKAGNSFGGVNTGTGTDIALVESDGTGADGYANGGETMSSGAANFAVEKALIEQGVATSDFIVFASAPGHDSYSIAQLEQGAGWYQNIKDHASEMKARAIAAGKTAHLHAVAWIQGEADADDATLSRSQYATKMSDLRDDLDADLRVAIINASPSHAQTTALHMLTTQTAYELTAYAGKIPLAQFDAVEANSYIHFVVPEFFFPRANDFHRTALGQLHMGRYFGRAYEQLVIEGREPDCIWPKSAYARGTTVYVKFLVPRFPLVLDTVLLGSTTDYGFKITDGTGTLTLSNIGVVNGDTISITINRTLGANPVVRLGLDYLASVYSANLPNGASHNLRDSTTDTFRSGGVTYPLWHVAPHFEKSITILDANA